MQNIKYNINILILRHYRYALLIMMLLEHKVANLKLYHSQRFSTFFIHFSNPAT